MYPETGNNDCKIYVGNLPDDVRVRDIEDLFYKYGKIVDIDLHDRPRKGPPFSFVEFEDERDAEDAVRGRDGYDFDGYRIRVEFPRLSSKGGGYQQRRGGGRGGGGGGGHMHMRDRGGARKGGFQCLVTNLPPTGSWQDLKDHFREAGDVTFTDVFRDGTGIVEFARYEHMKRAVRDLDDSKFRSHEGETAYINVKKAGRSPSRSRSRSPRRRSRSPRYSRSRSRSRSRSPSKSPRYSRSPRRFRSRSPRSRSRS